MTDPEHYTSRLLQEIREEMRGRFNRVDERLDVLESIFADLNIFTASGRAA